MRRDTLSNQILHSQTMWIPAKGAIRADANPAEVGVELRFHEIAYGEIECLARRTQARMQI